MQFYLPTPGFPLDKTLGIAQIFSLGGCSSWAAMLQVHNNELWIEHRGNCASPAEYQARLATNLPRNTWLPIVMHFVASHMGAGTLEIWFGDAVCSPSKPTYRKTGINFAFGDWTGDSLTQADSNQIGLKFGMYNFEDGNYTTGETRTIYYDNVSHLVGNPANAFATVKPMR
jgi:Polysaccharide lyase